MKTNVAKVAISGNIGEGRFMAEHQPRKQPRGEIHEWRLDKAAWASALQRCLEQASSKRFGGACSAALASFLRKTLCLAIGRQRWVEACGVSSLHTTSSTHLPLPACTRRHSLYLLTRTHTRRGARLRFRTALYELRACGGR